MLTKRTYHINRLLANNAVLHPIIIIKPYDRERSEIRVTSIIYITYMNLIYQNTPKNRCKDLFMLNKLLL